MIEQISHIDIDKEKNLIWNKITFQQSNSLIIEELVVNEPRKCIYKKLSISLFLFDLSLPNVKI